MLQLTIDVASGHGRPERLCQVKRVDIVADLRVIYGLDWILFVLSVNQEMICSRLQSSAVASPCFRVTWSDQFYEKVVWIEPPPHHDPVACCLFASSVGKCGKSQLLFDTLTKRWRLNKLDEVSSPLAKLTD